MSRLTAEEAQAFARRWTLVREMEIAERRTASTGPEGLSPPRDIQDMEGLLAVNPDVDVDFVRQWVREFATAMSMPDMLAELDRVLERSGKG